MIKSLKDDLKGEIAPSILSCNPLTIESEVRAVEDQIKAIHVDIMDGQFVPNFNGGPNLVKALREAFPDLALDVHLMVDRPEADLDAFIDAGADILTIHFESLVHPHRYLTYIQDKGVLAGLAINPGTSIASIADLLPVTDDLLIMSVNPGFGGQSFIEHTHEKIKDAKKLITENNYDCLVEIDGGVKPHNAKAIRASGADLLVAGSAVFSSEDPQESIRLLKEK